MVCFVFLNLLRSLLTVSFLFKFTVHLHPNLKLIGLLIFSTLGIRN